MSASSDRAQGLTHTAAETAAIIGGRCKASWLRQQARDGKIPYLMIGGSYHFSSEHITEILAAFEHRPTPTPPPAAAKPSRQRAAARPTGETMPPGVTQLKPRQPRTLRRLQASA